MEVGQKVYLKPILSSNRVKETQEYEIRSIGTKYLHVFKGHDECKFDKKTLKHINKPYSAQWELFLDKQELMDLEEFNSLHGEIENAFRYDGKKLFSLDQLRQIKRIIDGEEKVE